jgi:hypothetical protein
MQNIFLNRIIIIFLLLIIILIIPLFLDLLFRITVRRKRISIIKHLAIERSRKTNKPLIIFNDRYHGVIFDNYDKSTKKFTGDVVEIVSKLVDNCCVVIVSQTLEYMDKNDISHFMNQVKRISGNDYYFINIEKKSPRILWDYKIENIINFPFYLPYQCNIALFNKSKTLMMIQKIYSFLFKFLPIYFLAYETTENLS